MKCDKCGVREVTSFIQISHNGHMQKLFLCDECAKSYKSGMSDTFGLFNSFDSPMSLLPGLTKFFETPSVRSMRCPECGTSSEEFLKTGFVGCARCYEVFSPLVSQTVKKLQQSDRHIGKTPVGADNAAAEESRLRAELQEAVENGEYYKISELGEKLRKLSSGKKDGD